MIDNPCPDPQLELPMEQGVVIFDGTGAVIENNVVVIPQTAGSAGAAHSEEN